MLNLPPGQIGLKSRLLHSVNMIDTISFTVYDKKQTSYYAVYGVEIVNVIV